MNHDESARCSWCQGNPLLEAYHDEEWGVEERDGERLFECLCLEGQQAGLSWLTVLKKRESYRKRFHAFVPGKVAGMSDSEIDEALRDEGVIRLRLKLEAVRKNARAYLAFKESGGDFSEFLWSFVGGVPIVTVPNSFADTPVRTPESDAMSKALKKLGFTFVGSTICYAFMQAAGMAVDHDAGCRFSGFPRR